MRVALLAPFPLHLLPGLEHHVPGGSIATWLPQLSEAFAREQNWDFHWLTVTRQAVPPEPVRWQGQAFHCLQSPARGRIFRGYRPDLRLLRQRLHAIQPDVVHTWGTEDCYSLAGPGCGRPWLCSLQGILHEYLHRSSLPLVVRLQALYERRILRVAREITVESRWGAAVVQKLAPQARVHLVEYGVHPRFFTPEWQPEAGKPHALFIGSIDDRKGIEDAVRAFARPELRDMELRIAGHPTGSLAERLQRISTPNVQWLGRLSAEQTPEALSRAWCLLLPTRADTSPNVVKEARVLGLPVITTPHGGQSDYIHDGINGYLVEPGNIPTLAHRLHTLLSDLPTARRLGAALHEEQRPFFRPERTAELFLGLYRTIANAR